MKKKSQIRKYTVAKVNQLLQQEINPDLLKLYAEHVSDKKIKLQNKKIELVQQLNHIRKQSGKVAYSMVDNVKDRLEKRQKIVMNAQSRPTPDDIKAVSDLYSYMQNQTNLININSGNIQQLHNDLTTLINSLSYPNEDYSELDNQFNRLQAQCAKQEQQRDRLLSQRDKNRQFYKTIESTIEQYRIKWEKVESEIRQYQRQLDHLISYFKVRQQEDKEKVINESKLTLSLENQLIKAQEVLNFNSQKNKVLMAQKIDALERGHR